MTVTLGTAPAADVMDAKDLPRVRLPLYVVSLHDGVRTTRHEAPGLPPAAVRTCLQGSRIVRSCSAARISLWHLRAWRHLAHRLAERLG